MWVSRRGRHETLLQQGAFAILLYTLATSVLSARLREGRRDGAGQDFRVVILTTIPPLGTETEELVAQGGRYEPPFNLNQDFLCSGSKAGGGDCHYAVTRSYLAGFQDLGVAVEFNPPSWNEMSVGVIWILAGSKTLSAALEEIGRRTQVTEKSQSSIEVAMRSATCSKQGERIIVAGPNIPMEALGDERLDAAVFPSDWVKR